MSRPSNVISTNILKEKANIEKLENPSLDLSGNFYSTNQLVDLLKKSQSTFKSIDLIDTQFFDKAPKEIKKILKALPKRFESINMRLNYAGDNPDTFETFIMNLPSNIKSINLTSNSLDNLETSRLVSILEKIPSSVIELNIANSKFLDKSLEEMNAILKAIPDTVQTINLSDCYLDLIEGSSPQIVADMLMATGKNIIIDNYNPFFKEVSLLMREHNRPCQIATYAGLEFTLEHPKYIQRDTSQESGFSNITLEVDVLKDVSWLLIREGDLESFKTLQNEANFHRSILYFLESAVEMGQSSFCDFLLDQPSCLQALKENPIALNASQHNKLDEAVQRKLQVTLSQASLDIAFDNHARSHHVSIDIEKSPKDRILTLINHSLEKNKKRDAFKGFMGKDTPHSCMNTFKMAIVIGSNPVSPITVSEEARAIIQNSGTQEMKDVLSLITQFNHHAALANELTTERSCTA